MPNSMTHKPMKTHSLHANKIDIQDMALFGITYSYERVFLGCNGIIQRRTRNQFTDHFSIGLLI